MHSAIGAAGTYGSAGWTFHKKTVAPGPVTTQAPVSGDLANYEDPIQGALGKYLAGNGVYVTDDQYAAAAMASAAGCAAVCSATEHAADCAGFAFKSGKAYPCELYTKAGVEKTRDGAGSAFYKKKVAVTTQPPASGDLAKYDAGVDGRKGRYKQGTGQYLGGQTAASAEACAALCSSAAHASKCFAFSHKGTICDMHTAVGAGGTYGSAGWTFHKKTVAPS